MLQTLELQRGSVHAVKWKLKSRSVKSCDGKMAGTFEACFPFGPAISLWSLSFHYHVTMCVPSGLERLLKVWRFNNKRQSDLSGSFCRVMFPLATATFVAVSSVLCVLIQPSDIFRHPGVWQAAAFSSRSSRGQVLESSVVSAEPHLCISARQISIYDKVFQLFQIKWLYPSMVACGVTEWTCER